MDSPRVQLNALIGIFGFPITFRCYCSSLQRMLLVSVVLLHVCRLRAVRMLIALQSFFAPFHCFVGYSVDFSFSDLRYIVVFDLLNATCDLFAEFVFPLLSVSSFPLAPIPIYTCLFPEI